MPINYHIILINIYLLKQTELSINDIKINAHLEIYLKKNTD